MVPEAWQDNAAMDPARLLSTNGLLARWNLGMACSVHIL